MGEVRFSRAERERSVEIVPLVFDLPGDERSQSAQRPHPPHLGVQPQPRLVHDPRLDPAPRLNPEALELCAELLFEL